MRKRLQIISTLLWVLEELGWIRWAIVFGGAVSAVYTGFTRTWQGALPWGIVAVVLLIGGEIARRLGYTMFLPDPAVGAGDGEALPWGAEALVSGHMNEWMAQYWAAPRLMHAESARAYWLADKTPVRLALVQPGFGEDRSMEQASKACTWYRGSEVTTGWVIICWQVHPGVRLRYIGKHVLVGFKTPGEARALAQNLQADA